MKFKLLSMLICILALPVFAQTAAPKAPATQTKVAVSGADKDKLDLASTKLENLQLKAQTLQASVKEQLAALSQEFTKEQAAYQAAVKDARTHLNLPESAMFDDKTDSFAVPPTKPATPTK